MTPRQLMLDILDKTREALATANPDSDWDEEVTQDDPSENPGFYDTIDEVHYRGKAAACLFIWEYASRDICNMTPSQGALSLISQLEQMGCPNAEVLASSLGGVKGPVRSRPPKE